jgi:hypothetical protein
VARLFKIVRDCERWTSSIAWPAPIDLRLKELVDRAIDAGEAHTLSRSELLAALVAVAPTDGEKLREALVWYRKATVADVATGASRPSDDRTTNIIVLETRQPGRRPRR